MEEAGGETRGAVGHLVALIVLDVLEQGNPLEELLVLVALGRRRVVDLLAKCLSRHCPQRAFTLRHDCRRTWRIVHECQLAEGGAGLQRSHLLVIDGDRDLALLEDVEVVAGRALLDDGLTLGTDPLKHEPDHLRPLLAVHYPTTLAHQCRRAVCHRRRRGGADGWRRGSCARWRARSGPAAHPSSQ